MAWLHIEQTSTGPDNRLLNIGSLHRQGGQAARRTQSATEWRPLPGSDSRKQYPALTHSPPRRRAPSSMSVQTSKPQHHHQPSLPLALPVAEFWRLLSILSGATVCVCLCVCVPRCAATRAVPGPLEPGLQGPRTPLFLPAPTPHSDSPAASPPARSNAASLSPPSPACVLSPRAPRLPLPATHAPARATPQHRPPASGPFLHHGCSRADHHQPVSLSPPDHDYHGVCPPCPRPCGFR